MGYYNYSFRKKRMRVRRSIAVKLIKFILGLVIGFLLYNIATSIPSISHLPSHLAITTAFRTERMIFNYNTKTFKCDFYSEDEVDRILINLEEDIKDYKFGRPDFPFNIREGYGRQKVVDKKSDWIYLYKEDLR